jgi:two-component system nitrogen regulation response regulator NtrX
MVEVNCAAIPEELIESELFGHEKGAFTGATAMKKGKFDLGHEGTLFLDEIGDMSLKAQSKTLRILQEQKFERVGGSRTIHVDVRVIAATNKDLEAEIEKGRFRDDLYFRLNVIPIRVPPLRERTDDVPALVKEFLKEMALNTNTAPKEFTEEAILVLKRYPWPGNIRELRNLVERLVIMTQVEEVRAGDIPAPFNKEAEREIALTSTLKTGSFKEAKENFEKTFITAKLQEFKWNVSQTADALGIERSNLHKKIKAYGLDSLRPSSG